jgi:hypothetical protein
MTKKFRGKKVFFFKKGSNFFQFSISRIESCDMSGNPDTRKVVFVVTAYRNGAWPNGLTLDLATKRMYWIDAR